VLLPGYGSQHAHYAVFARHLASWGLATVGVDTSDQADHERSAREVSAVLDWAASGPLAAQLDASRIAVAGHSLGGKIAFFAAAIDPRVRAVIAWDPVDAGGPPCWLAPRDCHRWSVAPNSFPGDTGMMQQLRAASLIFSAPVGWANPREHHAERFWEGAPAPALWVHFPHGEHGRWPHGVPEQRISRRTQVAWLMHHLLGLPGMESYVTGEFMEEDVRRGLVTVAMRPAGPVFCAAPPAAG
jgi:pimeloyl-ACP methyl ester carboxylesterase